MVDGRVVKRKRKLPERMKESESPERKKKAVHTWMEDGMEVTGDYIEARRERRRLARGWRTDRK